MLSLVPHRPRSHQIETESRTQFERLLPSAWVYRSTSPDYGLDGEVELFENERATGQRFAVQLKGTDESDLKHTLRIRLKTETCEYYRSLDVPVLMVRYVASTETMFAEWFHALDHQPTSEDQATVTIRLSNSHEWSDETPARLVAGLGAFRWVHRPSLDLPLPVRVVTDREEVLGLPASDWARQIRQQMQRTPGLLTAPLESGALLPLPTIELSDHSLRANLLDVVSVTIPIGEIYANASRRESLPQDSIIALAVVLERAGHNDLAARLTLEFGAESTLIWQAGVAGSLSEALARRHRVTDALELVETLRARGDEAQLSTWLLEFAALRVSHSLSGPERARYREFLEAGVRREQKRGDPHKAAIAHYNLANQLRGLARPVEVFHHYRLAAKLYPQYRDLGYWCREAAGMLYEGGRFTEAVYFYERAREVGEEDWPVDGLLADALMFAGRYTDAQTAFEAALADPKQDCAEWRLKSWALTNLIQRTGTGVQSRQQQASNERADVNPGNSASDQRQQLEEALDLDLLSGLAEEGADELTLSLRGVAHDHDHGCSASRRALLGALRAREVARFRSQTFQSRDRPSSLVEINARVHVQSEGGGGVRWARLQSRMRIRRRTRLCRTSLSTQPRLSRYGATPSSR